MTLQPPAPCSRSAGRVRAVRPDLGRVRRVRRTGAPAAESVEVPMDAFLSGGDRNHPMIAVRGETDLATAGDLFRQLVLLTGAATEQIALDLSQVTFMDCAGLRALSAIDRHMSASGGSVRVAAVSPAVARLFELVGRCGASPGIPAPPRSRSPGRGGDPFQAAAAAALPARRESPGPAGRTEGL